MTDPNRSAVGWLLASDELAIRGMARRDLLNEANPADLHRVTDGPKVRALLSGQRPDGGFGVHPYRKWTGAHWRLVSLVELEVPAGEPRTMAALDTVLDWLAAPATADRGAARIGMILSRRLDGGQCARRGLPAWQRRVMAARHSWPSHCPRGSGRTVAGTATPGRAAGGRPSTRATSRCGALRVRDGNRGRAARRAADRTAELFLSHRIFRRRGTGEPIHPSWTVLHYPPYWHYDVLQALHLLARMDRVRDERAADALDLLEKRRLPDGRWRAGAYWWQPPGSPRAPEAVDWGRGDPNEMLTLNALRVLRAAGRA